MVQPYQRISFDKAVEWFEGKIPIPTESYDQIVNEAQNWAFTLSGVEKANILQHVLNKIAQILAGQSSTVTTFEEFAKDFDNVMKAGGYGSQQQWRTKLVFKNNISSAYAAGRWQQIQDSTNQYVQWWHDHPIVPRPHHIALHQKVFNKSDPALLIIAPPSGHGCGCKLLSISQRDIDNEGLTVETIDESVTVRDRVTGETRQVPAVEVDGDLMPIAEPGWYGAPGEQGDRARILEEAIARLSPQLREAVQNDIAQRQSQQP